MASPPSVAESPGIWELDKVISEHQTKMRSRAANHSKPWLTKTFFASTHYRAALQGGFLEAGNKSVILDLRTADCQYFVGRLYTGRLPDASRNDLFGLYVFADRTDTLALRRAVITRVVTSKFQVLPTFFEAAVALNSLPSISALYRRLLDTYTHHWMSEYPTKEDTLPNGFLVD